MKKGGEEMKLLDNELIAQYNISIKRHQYSRGYYYIDTPKDKRILRKVSIPKEQVAFQYEIMCSIRQRGFMALNPIHLTKKNMPYALYEDKLYVMQSYEDSEELDFKDKQDLKGCVSLLSAFHLAAKDIKSVNRNIENSNMKNIYDYFAKRYVEGVKLKKAVCKSAQRTAFEIMFLEACPYYHELEEKALSQIDREVCLRLISEAKSGYTIMHNDYNYHTVSKGKQNNYFINNMDNCTYNVQIIDLANLLTKIMQKNNWDIGYLLELIEVYNQIRPLSQDELKVLKAMLIFPEKYASICQKYTASKRRGNYSMFEVKWQNMIEYKEKQLQAASYIIRNL